MDGHSKYLFILRHSFYWILINLFVYYSDSTFMALMCLAAYLTLIPIVQKFGEGWRLNRIQKA
jgi:hypothetical protein